MLLRLICTIILMVLVAVFAGFNIGNSCSINLLFHKFENIPVFVTILFSFAAGVIVMLPFTVGKQYFADRRAKAEKKAEELKTRLEAAEKKHREERDSLLSEIEAKNAKNKSAESKKHE